MNIPTAQTVNLVYGSTGERSIFMGMDLTCDMGVAFALGEKPVIDKEIKRDKKKYTVGELQTCDFGLKYDLMLNMMLRDGTVETDTVVQVGQNGRLKEVYVVKQKEAYRMFGKTFYGKYTKNSNEEE
jgi:hypothetical protein